MELKSGFKQTEVGVIPEDWGIPMLGTLTILLTNGFVGTVTSHYASNENGVLYIQGYNVQENSLNFHGIKFVTQDFHASHMKSSLRSGDLLTVQTGDIGLTTIVPEALAGSNCHALIISRFDQKTVHPAFISYYLNSKPGRSRLKLIETGTTMKHLNVGDVLQFRVPLPATTVEQKAIADALSTADDFIHSLEQLIAKKRQIKQGAMQELLTGKKRLTGFTKSETRDSEIGALPGEWSVLEIGQIADVKTGPFGSSLHERDYVDDGTPIMTVEHLGERGITRANLPMVSDKDRRRLATYSLEEGDLVFSRVGSVDRNARVSNKESGWLFSGRILRVRASSRNVDTRFLSYQFHLEAFKQRIRTVAVGQTMASLNTQILRGVLICLPSLCEQSAIADVLSAMDEEIALAEARLAKARDLKQGMMQELLTGRIRLV